MCLMKLLEIREDLAITVDIEPRHVIGCPQGLVPRLTPWFGDYPERFIEKFIKE